MFSSGCNAMDKNGDNDCAWNWGDSFNITLFTNLDEPLKRGNFTIDFKLNKIFNLKASCALCGHRCEVDIPIVKRHLVVKMPRCPLHVPAGKFNLTYAVHLNDTSPTYGIGITGIGSAVVLNQNGSKIASTDLTVTVK